MQAKNRVLVQGIIVLSIPLLLISFFIPTKVHAASPTKIVHSRSSWQKFSVKTTKGTFSGQVIAIDMTNPKLKIYTLTSTTSKCTNNCPVAPLLQYVNRVKGFAGMNGTYFCPASYPECKGKTGSYTWQVFDSIAKRFIREKRFYGPMIAFDAENHWHFYREVYESWPGIQSFEQMYNTKMRGAITSAPILVANGKIVQTTKGLDKKQLTSKGTRGALAFKGKNMYFINIANATVPDLGAVMGAMKMELALNLDGGGSSALVFDGKYTMGPGRNIPNAIVVSEN